MTDANTSARVRAVRESGVGHVSLNRPEALNALDLEMVRALRAVLDAWRDDPGVTVVLLDGAGERGLCAGGDVRGLHGWVTGGAVDMMGTFLREEYALDSLIAEYPKPVVALADGITMGGGIGLAGHAALRLVTERSRLAMPETRIGFSPDVGGTWLLAQAPGRLGEYLALTGATMGAADAVAAGFADVILPSARIPALHGALAAGGSAQERIAAASALADPSVAPGPTLEAARAWIDDAFALDTVPDIIVRLRERPEPEARVTAEALERLSPVALTVALAAVRRARELGGLRPVLAQEYATAMWFAETQADFGEGVRALLIDKDNDPQWVPPSLAEVPVGIDAEALAFRPEVPLQL